jgi:hypothetical protein
MPVEPMVATEVLLLAQVPPETVLESVVVVEGHVVAVPVIVPAEGVVITVTICVTLLPDTV